ncbi:Ig-like domain-containing domain [Rufibacter quisquiliarum]|uniref:Uncharacterized protein (DUF2141 family) n=1 Tax=Rufibacter quisquiliarum TaxID=1549639 RepID=A0A839GLY1_9BACT|nr:Ig-like domain-containing domain [Rufibacter quisquiliarum]MBA9075947.1 uncharacterized protein (DUF2141 family) [Rufibacter quisquiliarum]
MKKQLKNAVYWVSLLMITGCANIGSPSGGPKDVTAPKLLSTNPKDGQTNVKPKTIVLTFNEAIQTIDLYRQLIVAPYTEATFKEKIKDGTLELEFTQPWEENTTYSLNFRNSIADVTEKNLAKSVVITFSTGSQLDSGRVSGTVKALYSATVPKDVNVLLYPTRDTAQIRNGRPLYVTTADSTGTFSFRNIKVGNYYIYALSETNNNLRYDNESELIAYASDSIVVQPAVEELTIILHTQDITPPRVITKRSFTNVYEVEYAEGLTNVQITSIEPTPSEARWTLTENGKTVRVYPVVAEEQKWLFLATDSASIQRTDTVTTRLSGKAAPRTIKNFEVLNGTAVKATDTLKLRFELPTKVINPAGAVTLVFDTTTTVTTTDAKQLRWNKNQTEATLLLPLQATRQISLSIDTTKIVPFIGAPYASATTKLQVIKKTNTGSLKVVTSTTEKNYTIQLLRENKVVREARNVKTVLWENLVPAKYQVRVLVDTNGNGKWDNGLLSQRRQPEPVILHPEIYEIRADWEIEMSPPLTF